MYKMQFFAYKICTYQIKVVILHRQTKKQRGEFYAKVGSKRVY